METVDLIGNDETSEWQGVDAIKDDSIRQGDCILLKDTRDDIGPVEHGLVITADCDIAQRKTSGYVSYVPLVSLEDYIFRFWVPEFLEAKGHAGRCVDAVRKLVVERMRETSLDAKPLSDGGLFRLAENGIASIFPDADSNAKRSKRTQAYISALAGLGAIRNRVSGSNVSDLRNHAVGFLRDFDLGTMEKLLDRATDSLTDAVTGSGAVDIYPISRLGVLKPSPQIVMLRFVRSIPEESVTTSHLEFRFGHKQACRVGRLRHEVKYECLQRFGRLFVRTGKPDSINESCRQMIQAAMGVLGSTSNG